MLGNVLLVYSILLISAIAFVSGIYLLGGLGWALIAFSACALGIAFLLMRGLTADE